jgi:hypothetical protein
MTGLPVLDAQLGQQSDQVHPKPSPETSILANSLRVLAG